MLALQFKAFRTCTALVRQQLFRPNSNAFKLNHLRMHSRKLNTFTYSPQTSEVYPKVAMASPYKFPEAFMDGPAPNLTRKDVDFEKGGLTSYKNDWAVVLDGVMTEEECNHLVAAAEATTNGKWERALVNIGGGMQASYEDIRKCGRIIWDDRDMVAKLWARIEAAVPEIHSLYDWPTVTGNGPTKRKETWRMTRLNERQRFLKYTGGEYFKEHCDGTYETPDGSERSYFTLHLYLNDAVDQKGEKILEGGATTFWSYNMKNRIDVVPKVGRVLLFQHRHLLHSGDDVVKGMKLTMRTDVMYKLEDKAAA